MFDNGKDVRNQPNFGSVCHQESRWEVLSIAGVSIRKYGPLNAPIRGFLSTEQSTGCARFVPTKLGNGLTLNEPAGEASAPPDAHVALLSVGSIWPHGELACARGLLSCLTTLPSSSPASHALRRS